MWSRALWDRRPFREGKHLSLSNVSEGVWVAFCSAGFGVSERCSLDARNAQVLRKLSNNSSGLLW